jgi:3-oxoacyl-[acyl-carrier-protein] synthase II
MPRVCVTGYGVVAPIGCDIAAFDDALFGGRSAIEPFELRLPGSDPVRVPIARCRFDENATRTPSRVPADRGTAMALTSAASAAGAAGLEAGSVDPERLGVFWGSGMGGASTFEATCRQVYGESRRIRPTSVVTAMPNAPVAELALLFAARGAAIGFACACASAAVAIGEAMRALRDGRLDMAVVGGSDALLAPGVIGAWQAMRVLAPPGQDAAHACRPFAADRAGFALGEGAAAFVLETEAHARARGARWTCVLSGFATNCDGLHITQPDAAGQARAMAAALKDAGLAPVDIGHVNAHGTATSAGDAAEAQSLHQVFGAGGPAVTATKAVLGHLLGAGGAVELLAMLRALERRLAPPTGHAAALDPTFKIDLVQRDARPLAQLRHAMSNSFAFGGTNAVLIASRAD